MIHVLRIISKAVLYDLETSDKSLNDRVEDLAQCIDIALKNVKLGDEITEFMNSAAPNSMKALTELIINYLDVPQQEVSVAKTTAVDPKDFYFTSVTDGKKLRLYFKVGPNGASNKIGAIKALRELTNCGLKESKDFVESLSGSLSTLPVGIFEESIEINSVTAKAISDLRTSGVQVLYTIHNEV